MNRDLTTEVEHAASQRGELVAFVQSCWHREIVDRCRDSFVETMAHAGCEPTAVEFFEGAGRARAAADGIAARRYTPIRGSHCCGSGGEWRDLPA